MSKQHGSVFVLLGVLFLAGCGGAPSAQSNPTPAAPAIHKFLLPTPGSSPQWITAGPDGALWFTETNSEGSGNQIGRITPAGQITAFPLPTPKSNPDGIAAGPDGNLWFTELGSGKVGRITPVGQITEFPLPDTKSSPDGIAAGPDGNLWFAEEAYQPGGPPPAQQDWTDHAQWGGY